MCRQWRCDNRVIMLIGCEPTEVMVRNLECQIGVFMHPKDLRVIDQGQALDVCSVIAQTVCLRGKIYPCHKQRKALIM